MNSDLKELEKLIEKEFEIVDICRYATSKEDLESIKRYFSKHKTIEIKIEYNHPTNLEDIGKRYAVIFSKKKKQNA